jgi:hypothetical protein
MQVEQLSPEAQAIIKSRASGMRLRPTHVATACCTGGLPWEPLTQAEYETLAAESDYAAW